MKLVRTHPWEVTYHEAVAIQEELRGLVRREGALGRARLVAGLDVSYSRGDDRLFAGIVLWDARRGEVVGEITAVRRARFPYIPGLLTFREGPAVTACFEQLHERPDVVMYDGQGVAHPRRMGLAAHMGVLTDLPSIGCAKSRLVGAHREPGPRRGDHAPLRDGREVLGSVLRTRDGVKPVFVSVGHRVRLARARAVVLQCTAGYRLPEPTRQAHLLVNRLRRAQTT